MPIWAYSTSMGELKSMTTDSDYAFGLRIHTEDYVVTA